ncbi:MAG: type II secretory pathway component PulF [Pirellulaceae bacterium]|jgi:type II secretory pathway component PulF
MSRFRYTAINANNASVHGIVDADSVDAALRKLMGDGLSSIEFVRDSDAQVMGTPVVDAPVVDAQVVDAQVMGTPVVDAPVVDAQVVDAQVMGTLKSDEASELAEIIADVAEADIPLDIGLLAAAREVRSRKVGGALRMLANHVSSGASLQNAVDSIQHSLPKHISGLIRVASRSGNLGEVLAELGGFHQRRRENWNNLWSSLAYPLVIAFFALMVLAFMLLVVVPPIREILIEFELELSAVTRFVFAISYAAGPLIAVLFAIPVILLICRIAVGEAGWRRAVNAIPFVGPAYHWCGVAELTRMVALFLRCQMTVGESMDMSAAGVSDAYIGELALAMSKRLERGEPLVDVMNSTPGIPKLVPALVGAGNKSDDIQSGMLSAAEVLDGLANFRISVVRVVVPMLAFLFVFVVTIFIVTGIFAPLLQLFSGIA